MKVGTSSNSTELGLYESWVNIKVIALLHISSEELHSSRLVEDFCHRLLYYGPFLYWEVIMDYHDYLIISEAEIPVKIIRQETPNSARGGSRIMIYFDVDDGEDTDSK